MTAVEVRPPSGSAPTGAGAPAPTVRVRLLPTAYDPPASPVTVATPSCGCCCCCCCCCLVTVTGVTAFTTAVVSTEADQPVPAVQRSVAILLAVSAVPAGLFVLFHGLRWADRAGVEPALGGLPALVVFLGLTSSALVLGGRRLGRSLGLAAGLACGLAAGLAIEFVLALVTVMLIELAVPAAVWIGARQGFRFGRDRAPAATADERGPLWWLPPPPGTPGLWAPPATGAPPADGSNPPWTTPPASPDPAARTDAAGAAAADEGDDDDPSAGQPGWSRW